MFYEVGMAHGRDKRVVLMVQDESKMPFDLREIRYLQYDPTDLTSLRLKLTEYVKNCISTTLMFQGFLCGAHKHFFHGLRQLDGYEESFRVEIVFS